MRTVEEQPALVKVDGCGCTGRSATGCKLGSHNSGGAWGTARIRVEGIGREGLLRHQRSGGRLRTRPSAIWAGAPRVVAGNRPQRSRVHERPFDRGDVRGTDPTPRQPVHPVEPGRIITDNILPHFEIVPVEKKDHAEALRVVGYGGWPGGKIYDPLLIGCAARSEAERIYTFNLADFRQLAPNLEGRICAPS